MKSLIIFLSIAVVSFGILAFTNQFSFLKGELDNTTIAQTKESKFRFLNGSFYGDNATYTFQTPPEEKNYAEDCIGCEQEVGNAVIWAEFGCPKKAKYLFESNSKIGVVEKGKKLDKNGVEIGERRLVVFKDKNKVVGARVFWIEGDDFWAVQAPSIESAKALEESEEYNEVRKKVAEEIKNYVPIQNANTQKIKATKEKECYEQ